MRPNELREKYLRFFKENGHAILPSASLIPENDPTVLFTTAGMHPLVPYLMGETHPEGQRLASAQKCVRTDDIDEIGDFTHHTFFEMLGNWSLGDYFKEEAIKMSFEFLTSPKWLGLDINRLAVSVFAGDADAPFDSEAFNFWKNLGIPEARIAKLPKKNNWWGPAGVTGPCGPDTEIFYWAGEEDKIPASFNDDNPLWVEIWNNVFMEYNKKPDGSFEPLSQKNVDTGMGMERTLAALNGLDDNYKTELWINIIKKIEELSGKKYGQDSEDTRAIRIIADHIKAATFIIGDNKGAVPSNTGAGYIVRRLIRRAIRYGKQIDIKKENWVAVLAETIINDYSDFYGELEKNKKFIFENLDKEENKFSRTLEKGLKEFEGKKIFDLYQTYGFPPEMTFEEMDKRGIVYNKEELKKEFNAELKTHQDLSRTASAGMFKGGLADSGEATKKLHTTAHLLLSALRKVLGENVLQKGSNITAERLRFDFSYPVKMTDEQKKETERLVNEAIAKNLSVSCEEKSLAEAKAEGAMGVFDSKYGEKVKIYTIGEGENFVSKEICGGPHVSNTGELGHFKITKEESSSGGVRRIKAILE